MGFDHGAVVGSVALSIEEEFLDAYCPQFGSEFVSESDEGNLPFARYSANLGDATEIMEDNHRGSGERIDIRDRSRFEVTDDRKRRLDRERVRQGRYRSIFVAGPFFR